MPMPVESKMIEAVLSRDKAADGLFVYGVVTTGIFCLPSCSSKMAKLENLRFFPSIELAMLAGFRACKRCCPMGGSNQLTILVEVARYIEQHSDEKLTLVRLGKLAGLSASRLQRVFKQAFTVSPKEYQDAVRMGNFKRLLKQGEGVTDAIYSSGYGSISRMYGEASRNIGMSPKAYRSQGEGEVIYYACRQSDFGFIMMAATEKGVCFVQFSESEELLLNLLISEFPKAELMLSAANNTVALDDWIEALDRHINQGAPRPDLPLDIRGTAFQIKVWQFLLSIKDGDIVSYREVADSIDKPKAVRAVASACGKNRIGVLIPCHRVLRSDGNLGGYRWGMERKRVLLDNERSKRHHSE